MLIEQFTNSGCPPCASNTPIVAAYVNANPSNVLMLSFHTSFPYLDSMYHENPLQSDQRVAFYNVSGVPTSRVDGNFFAGNLVPVLAPTILSRATELPRYNITFTNHTLVNSLLTATVNFESIDASNMGQNLTAQIVVVEKQVLKSSYVCCAGANSETEYPWVVRRMLPDASGTTLLNTGLGLSDSINVSWTASNIKDFNEMRMIAFVQNTVTKEIYQSELSSPLLLSGIPPATEFVHGLFEMENPVQNEIIKLRIYNKDLSHRVKLMDLTGKLLLDKSYNTDTDITIEVNNINSGIYFISLESNTGIEVRKLIIP